MPVPAQHPFTSCLQHSQASGTPPTSRNAHTAVAVGTDIYVFGGRSGIDIGEGALGDLHRFDTLTSTWSRVEPATDVAPPKRSYHAMAAAGGRLYVFGGCGEGATGRLAGAPSAGGAEDPAACLCQRCLPVHLRTHLPA